MNQLSYPKHYEMKLARLEKIKQTQGKCEVCGGPAKSIHHIDFTKNNHKIENLAVLCYHCHNLLHSKNCPCSGIKRTTKMLEIYGHSITEMAEIFNVPPTRIYGWHKQGKLKEAMETQKPPCYESKYVRLYGFDLADLHNRLHLPVYKIEKLHREDKLQNILDGLKN